MLKTLVVFFLLLISIYDVFSQYMNTDEMVVVPGEDEPVSMTEFIEIQDSLQELKKGYLAKFLIPGNNGYIISRFGPRSGRMHYGTDIRMKKGDTIVATNDGEIARANWGYGFGNLIIVKHKNGIQTYYAHLSKFLVKKGKRVTRGEPIGLAGSTGRARGNHLHFEMRENGTPFDPELVFDFKNEKIREDAYEMESLSALHKKLKPKGYSTNLAVPEYYKVRPGDSLWAISRRYKTPIKEICRLNNISENTILQIGQPLRMY